MDNGNYESGGSDERKNPNVVDWRGISRSRIKTYTKLIESGELKKEDIPYQYNLRGEEYYKLGEYDKAIEDHTKAIMLGYSQSYSNRAVCYYKQRDFDKAIENWKKNISKNESDNSWIYREIAVCYKEKGDIEKAKDYLYKSEERFLKSKC